MADLHNYIWVGLLLCLLTLIEVSPVTGTNCKNNSTCGAHGSCPTNTAPCVCTDGYKDDNCSTAPCTKVGKECGDHGTCNTKETANVKCDCNDGYTGVLCKTVPICTKSGSECGDNGKCNTTATPYKCKCNDGYSGDTCKTAPSSSSVAHLSALLMASLLLWFVM